MGSKERIVRKRDILRKALEKQELTEEELEQIRERNRLAQQKQGVTIKEKTIVKNYKV